MQRILNDLNCTRFTFLWMQNEASERVCVDYGFRLQIRVDNPSTTSVPPPPPLHPGVKKLTEAFILLVGPTWTAGSTLITSGQKVVSSVAFDLLAQYRKSCLLPS